MKRFPLSTLIRLYELLKNSRLMPQMRPQQLSSLAHFKAKCSSHLGVDWMFGGG
jgi:hypothetical protein